MPKNKNKIGAELGRQIETKLLNPEQLANDLCKMVMDLLQNKDIVLKIKLVVQNLLRNHESKIVDFLVPRIEASLCDTIQKFLTKDKLTEIWDNTIVPQLKNEENRKLAARQIIDGLKRRSPDLIVTLKAELREMIFEYISGKAILKMFADSIADGVIEFINWDDIENRMCAKLENESTTDLIKEELLNLINKIEEWTKTEEGSAKVELMLSNLKEKIVVMIREFLNEKIPALAASVLDSESLWQWIENELLPNAKPQIETFIKSTGKDIIIGKLNISGRVTDAVDKQDVEEFHSMINSIAAQHLGAIQVLGYFLGAIVGAAQIFIK